MAKKSVDFKNLTRKQKILIVVATIVLVAIVALSITLPIVFLGGNRIPELSFSQFDRLSDEMVTVTWTAVPSTDRYTLEYCYGTINDENVLSIKTDGTKATILRKTGPLSVRVKADEGSFSEWIYVDIPALKLKAPQNLTASDDFAFSWSAVKYSYFGENVSVSKYTYDICFDGEWILNLVNTQGNTHTESFAEYIKLRISSFYQEGITPWEDVEFSVRVKATALPAFSASETAEETFLKGAYVDSDYATIDLTITKEIYEGL